MLRVSIIFQRPSVYNKIYLFTRILRYLKIETFIKKKGHSHPIEKTRRGKNPAYEIYREKDSLLLLVPWQTACHLGQDNIVNAGQL